MLSEKELKDYFEKHNISEPVREYIRLTRAGAVPARRYAGYY